MKFFKNEDEMQAWFMERLRTQAWHAQEFQDAQTIGIPDIGAAHNKGGEYWFELKCAIDIHSVHDHLTLKHPLTPQQWQWLIDRATAGSQAGVVVAFQTGPESCPQPYLAWVPVAYWMEYRERIIMQWVMNRWTVKLEWLHTKRYTVREWLRGIEIGQVGRR